MPERPIPLVAHPAHASAAVQSVHVDVVRAKSGLNLVYDVRGRIDQLVLPSAESGVRRDRLWQHTCFELFVRDQTASGYVEFNFSPGGDWAAYAFDAYRAGQRDLAVSSPRINTTRNEHQLIISIEMRELPSEIASQTLKLGPTVILETKDGLRSYWALDHINEAPDFHQAETFTLSRD